MNPKDLDTHEMVRFNQENSWPTQKRFINLKKKYLIEHLQGKLGEKKVTYQLNISFTFCQWNKLNPYRQIEKF